MAHGISAKPAVPALMIFDIDAAEVFGREKGNQRGIADIRVRRTSFQSGSGLGAWPCRSAV